MAHLRAVKAGLGRDCQMKIDSAFTSGDAIKVLEWVKEETGADFEIADSDDRTKSIDNFHDVLKDGLLLCQLINKYLPDELKLDMTKKTFQKSNNPNFEINRERERLDSFLIKCVQLGVPRVALFQIDNLYELTNLSQVCAGLAALGSEIESLPSFTGERRWPKKYVDPKAEEKRKAAKQNNKLSCTYSGILYGAPDSHY
ncbi:myophilin [Patella vulgata]|uniref:myophilin n=1 Tax=Patella vulgata TaxID=6465 RepID=UPI00217FB9AE|nr:myophilin [Patella vulgata]